MTNEDLAYAAGIIDGEGCIGAYNIRPKGDARASYYQVCVRVTMKGEKVPTFLHHLFGGSLRVDSRKDRDKPKRDLRHYHAWQVRNLGAERVINALLPYLKEKREQAVVALEFCELRRKQRASVGRCERYSEAMLAERNVYVARLKELKNGTSRAEETH